MTYAEQLRFERDKREDRAHRVTKAIRQGKPIDEDNLLTETEKKAKRLKDTQDALARHGDQEDWVTFDRSVLAASASNRATLRSNR